MEIVGHHIVEIDVGINPWQVQISELVITTGGGESGNASSPEDGVNLALTLELLRGKLEQLEQVTGEDYEVSIATATRILPVKINRIKKVIPLKYINNIVSECFSISFRVNSQTELI